MKSGPPAYSIIIVTYLRPAALCATLRELSQCVDPEVGEVIVVDQCPPGPLPSDVLAIPGLKYIALDHPGMVNARNVGLVAARGRVVLFLDDDVVPALNLVAAHLEAYTDPVVGGVAGRILDPGQKVPSAPHPRVFDRVEGWRHAHFDHTVPGDVMTARGCNMSFRRDILLRLGGFDPYISIFRDDSDICLRVVAAGYVIRFAPRAELVHLNAPSGGTRGDDRPAAGYWGRELRMYLQHHRHYRDNLYFILRHFRGSNQRTWLAHDYCTHVGLSRWPWRLVGKNVAFLLALWAAARRERHRRSHPCTLPIAGMHSVQQVSGARHYNHISRGETPNARSEL